MNSESKLNKAVFIAQCATCALSLAVLTKCARTITAYAIADAMGFDVTAADVQPLMEEIAEELVKSYGFMGGMEAGLLGLVRDKDGKIAGYDFNICGWYVKYQ